MNSFWIWFSTGLQHILDWNGYDHILYVISLCALFSIKEWKKLLTLITAFTIGHSLTLACSVLDVFTIKASYIELLIPVTIILTCLVNIGYVRALKTNNKPSNINNYYINYGLALLFGFVHGMGFSYLLKSMLSKAENSLIPLVSFNLGLELGQLMIVCAMLLLSVFLTRFTQIKKTNFIFFTSLAVFTIAVLLFVQRLI